MGSCDSLINSYSYNKNFQYRRYQNQKPNLKRPNPYPIKKNNNYAKSKTIPNYGTFTRSNISQNNNSTVPEILKYHRKQDTHGSLLNETLMEIGKKSSVANDTFMSNFEGGNSIYADNIIQDDLGCNDSEEQEYICKGAIDEDNINKAHNQSITHNYKYYVKNNDL